MGKITTFANRLKALLVERQITQAELARRTGISKSSITHYVKGDWEGKQDAVYAIAAATNVNEAWLMGYDVPMDKNPSNPKPSLDAAPIPPGYDPPPKMVQVPLIGAIACGEPITAEQNIEGYVEVPERWHASFTLTCRGHSMEPKIKDGDIVAIRSDLQVENGQIAAVRIGDEATLKKVYYYPERLILRPVNDDYEEITLEGEKINDARIEGKAVGLCRDL